MIVMNPSLVIRARAESLLNSNRRFSKIRRIYISSMNQVNIISNQSMTPAKMQAIRRLSPNVGLALATKAAPSATTDSESKSRHLMDSA